MILDYRIYVNGVYHGECRYQNTADILYQDERRCGCNYTDLAPSVEARTVGPCGEFALRWCLGCDAIRFPPFDGYTYHDYGCDPFAECKCGEVDASRNKRDRE